MSRIKKKLRKVRFCILLFLGLIMSRGFSTPVSLNEATAVADLWYAMELNSGYLKITETERAERLLQMGNREVFCMVAKDELLESYPVNQPVLAYIIKYTPKGFVVVSGDDRIEPIMVCSVVSEFRWDQPERNFLRHYLGKVMPALWSGMPLQVHENWIWLRRKMSEKRSEVTYDDIGRAIYVLWETVPWDQRGYYDDTCRAHNGNEAVPTGCVATAMAIKMKFHNWPPFGVGAHAYSDTVGDVQFDHNVNFGNQSYDWASTPDTCLTAPNADVARIMYHAGVSVDMNYEVDGSGANTMKVADAMNDHFLYYGTVSDSGSWSVHEVCLSISVIGKLPAQIGGWGHSVIVDGYRTDQTNQWHINCGWSGANNAWYRLDSMPYGGGSVYISNAYSQPSNWVYVNDAYTGSEDGRILHPYNTLLEGDAAAGAHGEMLIRTGTYTGSSNVPMTFNNNNTVRAYAGDVMIGDNVWLGNYAAIKLHSGGECKITP
jgi:hypothetical protein